MNNSQVAHLWASQNKDYGKGSNFFFEGTTIYSYGRHFPIARFVENKSGEKAVLFTNKRWGNATAKHIGYTRRAIASDIPVFNVEDVKGENPISELLGFAIEFEKAVEVARKAKSNAGKVFTPIGIFDAVQKYCEFFGLKNPIDTAENRAVLEELSSKHQRLIETRDEREAAARDARIKREKEKIDESVFRFLNEGLAFAPNDCLRLIPPLLRKIIRNGEYVVQTSHGAEVPLEDARRSFAFIKAIWNAGREWHRNGETHRVGSFDLTSIASDKVKVGCHEFQRFEIERFAAQEGWA
jgi:hypothetical protein